MAQNWQNQLHMKLRKTRFAILLDEATTVSGKSLLINYEQYIDDEDLKQDVLTSTKLETTTGQGIFLADSHFLSNNLSTGNLVACSSDPDAAMMARRD